MFVQCCIATESGCIHKIISIRFEWFHHHRHNFFFLLLDVASRSKTSSFHLWSKFKLFSSQFFFLFSWSLAEKEIIYTPSNGCDVYSVFVSWLPFQHNCNCPESLCLHNQLSQSPETHLVLGVTKERNEFDIMDGIWARAETKANLSTIWPTNSPFIYSHYIFLWRVQMGCVEHRERERERHTHTITDT